MPRLETQINQIYLTHPENKKTSLILYEEAVTSAYHVFILAELRDMVRKSEGLDLKKISEIILESFRSNKKLSAEGLFEAALAQINQNLADLAHEGHKSWVGKFSCLIMLKSADNIFLANDGQTAAWLKRKGELLEILPAEKRGLHPLKTFINFTQGKISDGDGVIITTANIFNYVSFELLGRVLNQSNIEEATAEISKILKDSADSNQAFCAFLLEFGKKPIPIVKDVALTEVYAPLPEEIESEPESKKLSRLKIPVFGFLASIRERSRNMKSPALRLPKIPAFKWPVRLGFAKGVPGGQFYKNLSAAGKFFFISFTIFAILFAANLAVFSIRSRAKKATAKIDDLVNQINKELGDAQSALIYKNDNQALQLVATAQADFNNLNKLDPAKAATVAPYMEAVKNQVNKISIVSDPKVYVELKHHPIFLAKNNNGFLLGNQDSNQLSSFVTNLTDYFVLNSLKSNIVGIAFFAPAGVVVATTDKLDHIDTTLKQFEPIVVFGNNEIDNIKNINGNLYVHDKKNNQIIKVTYSKNKYGLTGISQTDAELRDFSLDKDVYLLYADKLEKFTSGALQAFKYPTLADPITNATRISVASNIYILEPTKKRLIILSKLGVLQSQIYFPNVTSLFDFSVDETGRAIYLLDDNKLLKINF